MWSLLRQHDALTDSGPALMGILNVTPDSFSDGGAFVQADQAIMQGMRLISEGADILDIGGESTRPGAHPVSETQELERVLPVIEGLRQKTNCPISIDTTKPEIARACIEAGANLWNDVSALSADPRSLRVAADLAVPVVLMHMQGQPRTMQNAPHYQDVTREVIAFLQARIKAAIAAGLEAKALLVDPGIGFGKTLEHNLQLMKALPILIAQTGCPLVFGASRKRFIQALDPQAEDPMQRLGGSLAAALYAAQNGAQILRVHDVRATRQALNIDRALRG